jgi:predicted AAA+ superfamily ATPase
MPVVALLGIRQCGKTFLSRQVAAELEMEYVSLDDDRLRRAVQRDPTRWLSAFGGQRLVIDEAQRAPKLWLALKAHVDRDNRPGQILLTGSSQPRLQPLLGDALLGRSRSRVLRPVTIGEQLDLDRRGRWSELVAAPVSQWPELLREWQREAPELEWPSLAASGGLPRYLTMTPQDRRAGLEDYIQSFIDRDVRQVLQVGSVGEFDRFVRIVAAHAGSLRDTSSLATELASVSARTVARWLAALELSFLVHRVPPYTHNAGSRILKRKKVYFADSALSLAAAAESDPTGHHLETLLLNELKVWTDVARDRQIFHWRTQSGQEVDWIVSQGSRRIGVEIKATPNPGARSTTHLHALLTKARDVTGGLLLTCDPEIRVWSSRLVGAPWWLMI